MSRSLHLFALAGAAVLTSSAASGAALIQSFENGDLTTPLNVELQGGVASSGFATLGTTDGDASYRITAEEADSSGGFKSLLRFNVYENSDVLAALRESPVIAFDVTVGPDNDPTDDIGFTKMAFATNSQAAGYEGYFGSDYQINFGDSLRVVYTLPQAQVDALNADASVNNFTQFTIATNSFPGVAPTIYLDNITAGVIPEPASLALLGIGSLALLGRRR